MAVSVDCVAPPPRQGFAAPVLAMLTALRVAALRCAWLCAALDPDVRSASLVMNVSVAMNRDKSSLLID